jgi:O-antigen/teichoic acid export membrane protein
VLSTSDRFLLGHYSTLEVVALYNVGYIFGKGLQMVSQSVNQAWTPFFFKTVKEEDPEAKQLFAYTATYFAFVLCLLGLAVIAFAREAVLLLGGREYLDAMSVTKVIVLASMLQGMFYVPSRGLFLEKKTAVFPLIIGVSGALNVGLNLVLIPAYGMMGAAWSTVAGYALAVGLTYVISQRYYPIRYDVRRLVHLVVVFGVLAAAARFFDGGSVAEVAVRAAILAAYPVVLLLTGFFEPGERRALRRAGGKLRARLIPQRHGAA